MTLSVTGRLFQARIWREYAVMWDRPGLLHDWVAGVLREIVDGNREAAISVASDLLKSYAPPSIHDLLPATTAITDGVNQ